MPAPKIRVLLELLLMLLAVFGSWLFPWLGAPNQLAQTIAFTASMSLAVLYMIRKWRLPRTTDIDKQSPASYALLPYLTFAVIARDHSNEGLSAYGNLFILLMIGTLIIVLCERFALRGHSNAQ